MKGDSSQYYEDNPDRLTVISRVLVKRLRHGTLLDSEGYVKISTLLLSEELRKLNTTMHDVDEIVRGGGSNDKMRLAWNADKTKIKATQGHSVAITDETNLYEKVIPKECIHGTFYSSLDGILREGLNRANRTYVHFVESTNGALSGIRDNSELLIYVDVRAALQEGHEFLRSENGVILSKGPFRKELIVKAVDKKTREIVWREALKKEDLASNSSSSSSSSNDDSDASSTSSGSDSASHDRFRSAGGLGFADSLEGGARKRERVSIHIYDDMDEVEKVKTLLYNVKPEERDYAVTRLLRKTNHISASRNDIYYAADYVQRNPTADLSSPESVSDALKSDTDDEVTDRDVTEQKYCLDLLTEYHGLNVKEWLRSKKAAKEENIRAAAERVNEKLSVARKLAQYIESRGESVYEETRFTLNKRVLEGKSKKEDVEEALLLYNRWQRTKAGPQLKELSEYLLWFHRFEE
eukprot:GEMP01018271.1.p1 GENE.GEMP01018271.1~~GEMP01018271.1.p1  ORF type:complete len:467 (+),score=107.79 GEMP01018271.1:50-1450(+)